ncbi:MAG: IreB family regulatory phosphoprotein [Lachnospiraceae bacterium]|nr:IreB family regulatory phosphoprotein [Lachnospiraceae bacterium]MBR6349708.1 IreB family regulatory phosphoprotein [Lachnospiraceae bacterium]
MAYDFRGECREALTTVYNALKEKGYNPIDQITGYLLSNDPSYITTYNNARNAIQKVDRDELIGELLLAYFGDK